MTKAKGQNVGELPTAALLQALPEALPIRKGARGALYVVSPWGAWYLNTPAGQDYLLSNGRIYSPADQEAPTDAPGRSEWPAVGEAPPTPAAPGATPRAPAAPAAPAANDDHHDNNQKARAGGGVLGWLGDFE